MQKENLTDIKALTKIMSNQNEKLQLEKKSKSSLRQQVDEVNMLFKEKIDNTVISKKDKLHLITKSMNNTIAILGNLRNNHWKVEQSESSRNYHLKKAELKRQYKQEKKNGNIVKAKQLRQKMLTLQIL